MFNNLQTNDEYLLIQHSTIIKTVATLAILCFIMVVIFFTVPNLFGIASFLPLAVVIYYLIKNELETLAANKKLDELQADLRALKK